MTFEGIEGCGKSTQIRLLSEFLKQQGFSVHLTREPGGSSIGRKIRKLLLDRRNEQLVSMAELLLYAADRAQHCEEVIRPLMQSGKIVLCDRFMDATTAYQEGGRRLPSKLVSNMNRLAAGGLIPRFTFLIDCPVSVGLSRARKRAERAHDYQDRFERIEISFHERVRRRYLKIAREEKKRLIVIDGSQSIEQVHQKIVQCWTQVLCKSKGINKRLKI